MDIERAQLAQSPLRVQWSQAPLNAPTNSKKRKHKVNNNNNDKKLKIRLILLFDLNKIIHRVIPF